MPTVTITRFRADLRRILDEVERGIVDRITPEPQTEREAREAAVNDFIAERAASPRTGMSVDEILAARREGRT